MERNPRTRTLRHILGCPPSFRLSERDRLFLRDLARVQIIDAGTADRLHYGALKNGAAGSLDRLVRAGILSAHQVQTSQGRVRAWSFASPRIARAWGGGIPNIGAKRTALHELVTSRLYFALDRPADFRVASELTAEDRAVCRGLLPDAMYTSADGEAVLVEADSGQYTRAQIAHKQARWVGLRQVWGQPPQASARVPLAAGIEAYRL